VNGPHAWHRFVGAYFLAYLSVRRAPFGLCREPAVWPSSHFGTFLTIKVDTVVGGLTSTRHEKSRLAGRRRRANAADRTLYWLVRHWIVVFDILTGLYMSLPWLALVTIAVRHFDQEEF
jgi:hypothetical protein